MKQENSRLSNNKANRFKIRPIICLLIGLAFLSVILLVTMLIAARDIKPLSKKEVKNKGDLKQEADQTVTEKLEYDKTIDAIVAEVNIDNKEIKLIDMDSRSELSLIYSGGSRLTDKYGQDITAGSIVPGLIVEAGYIEESGKLVTLQASDDAWEYTGVTNFSIDKDKKALKIASDIYKLSEDLMVVDEGALVSLDHIAVQDELLVRGVDKTIWSITVTKGHGTVKITDCEAFIGGSITIGYEAMQKVEEGLVLTVREGEFSLTVENGIYSGTKSIAIYRNKESLVSLGDLGPEKEKTGLVTFNISPFGANLFIDDELTLYGQPIELAYGRHKVAVSLGGFTDYEGSIDVKLPGAKININLPEAKSNKQVTITEAEDTSIIAGPEAGYDYWELNGPEEDEHDQESDEDEIVDHSEDNEPEEEEAPTIGDEVIQQGHNTGDKDEEGYQIDNEHYIYVKKPDKASVYLNGEFMGIAPGTFKKVIGTHVFTFIREGYETKSYIVEIDDDGLDKYLSFDDLIKEN